MIVTEISQQGDSFMSNVNKENKEFKFIKEQVIPKKRKKLRKWLLPFLMTIFMAIIFGLVAALTFCIAEPKLYKLLHKDETNPFVITPQSSNANRSGNEDDPGNSDIIDNTIDNDDPNSEIDETSEDPGESNNDGQAVENPDPNDNKPLGQSDQNMVNLAEPADIEDYISMYRDVKELSDEVNKSILTVSSIIDGKDWFGNPIEKRIYTVGVVLKHSGSKLMLLVSLDRIKDASSIKLEINENTSIDAVLHDYESELNLAIISVNTIDIPTKLMKEISVAKLGESYTLSVGSPAIALGSPNGYPSSIDVGIITSKGSLVSITDNELELFNTNMVFNKESDGILVNLKGEIIGIITRTLKNDLNKELSTAIGISKVRTYIDSMIEQTPRTYCGVVAENLTKAAMIEHNVTRGVYVYEVKKDSPAFNGGLMSGDIILNVGDRFISNMNNFYNVISEYTPGEQAVFKIKRTSGTTDKEMEIKLVLGEKIQ